MSSQKWSSRRFSGFYNRGVQGMGEATNAAKKDISESRALGKSIQNEQSQMRQQLGDDVSARRNLVQRLESQSRGEGPSLAQAQMRQAQDRGLAQQLASAGRSRGANSASAQRQLMRNQQQASRQVAQDSSIARMQEQQAAQSQLGQLASQSQQQLGAQLGSERALTAQQNASAQDRLNALNVSQFTNRMSAVQGKLGSQMAHKGIDLQQRQADNQLLGAALGSAGSVGAAMAMSDKNKKKNIKKESVSERGARMSKENDDLKKVMDKQTKEKKEKKKKAVISAVGEGVGSIAKAMKSGNSGGADLVQRGLATAKSDEKSKKSKKSINSEDFLSKLKAYSYDYKDPKEPGAGDGRHFSVMAQDLEKAGSIGKSMVQDTDQGKMVDYGKGFGAILASQVQLNERLAKLESKKKKK